MLQPLQAVLLPMMISAPIVTTNQMIAVTLTDQSKQRLTNQSKQWLIDQSNTDWLTYQKKSVILNDLDESSYKD